MRLSLVLDCRDPDSLADFWTKALRYRAVESPPSGYQVLVPAEGAPDGPVFILQAVPEERVGKNRMHVDIHPPADLGVPALVAQLEALGATRIGAPMAEFFDTIGIWWQVMTDPEGNEFCVSADPGHAPPPTG
jgi:Glyoxalase-like domain